MSHYINDRRGIQMTFSALSVAALLLAILTVFVVLRTSACTVPDTSSHHELLK